MLFAALPFCGSRSLRCFVICCGTILWFRKLAMFCYLLRYYFVTSVACDVFYSLRYHFVTPEACGVLLFTAVPFCGSGSVRRFVICCGTILWHRKLKTVFIRCGTILWHPKLAMFCYLLRCHFVAWNAYGIQPTAATDTHTSYSMLRKCSKLKHW